MAAKLSVRSKKNVTEDLVGVDDQVKELIEKLDVGSDDVRFLGIHGMGGIGKTTLAKVVFNQLFSHFQVCNFLSNVGESSQRHGLINLQKQLLSKFCPSSTSDQIDDEDDGINKIKRVLCSKKVLIVLDDVDQEKQLKNLAGKGSWFGPGSRIIVTTRDQSVLTVGREATDEGSLETSVIVLTHEVREIEFDHALKLFSRHAFRRDSPPYYYTSLSKEVVSTLGKLPLALEVIAASLFGKSKIFWKDTLRKLKKAPPIEVGKRLMISFDMLDKPYKQVFLDVACFFVGEDKTYPCYMWDADEYPHDALEVLFLRSFIKINYDNTIWMHDLMRDLGRKIVRDENFPFECSRAWNQKEALSILKRKEGSQKIRALSHIYEFEDISLNHADFPMLRFFRVYNACFVGDFSNLFSSLTWLSCQNCHLNFGPNISCPPNLVVLDLSYSRFSEEGIGWIKAARKLKVLNLRYCSNLTRTPDLSLLVSLEILDLEFCRQLVEIDPSIGELKHLTTLNLRNCSSLRELPEGIGCPQASTKVAMPPMPREFQLSLTLDLSGTQISKLPHSIGGMMKITVLRLCGCWFIKDLPDWVWNLQSLIKLDLSETYISHLSDSIGNLKQLTILRMRGMKEITKLPSTIWLLEKLEVLDARGCEKLTGEIPEDIERLSCLRILDLSKTQISGLPTTVSHLSNLQELYLYHCHELRQLPELPLSLTRLILGRGSPSSFLNFWTTSLGRVTALPTSISTLTQLKCLSLNNIYVRFLPRLPSSLIGLRFEYVMTTQPLDFSNLINLSFLDLQGCLTPKSFEESGVELEDLEMRSCNLIMLDALFQLEMKRLTFLSLVRCEFRPEVVDLSHMKNLREVWLEGCPLLVEIRGLEELGSLSSLTVWRCSSMERMSDLSKLRKLRELKLVECSKLRSVEGLNHLESLKRLRICDCESLESLADTSNLDLLCLEIAGCEKLPRPPIYCKRAHCAGCTEFFELQESSITDQLRRHQSRNPFRWRCWLEEVSPVETSVMSEVRSSYAKTLSKLNQLLNEVAQFIDRHPLHFFYLFFFLLLYYVLVSHL